MKRLVPFHRFALAASAIAILTLAAGCGARHTDSDSTALPTATVQIQIVKAKSRVATEDEIGTIRPKLSAIIEAKISGSIKNMLVVPGQSVKRGDLLIQLNAREIKARHDQAAATLKQAEQDWKRTSALYKEQASSRAEYDDAAARYGVAQAAMAETETMMGYADIRAPFDGIITHKNADVGDLAAPGKPLIEMEDPGHLRLEAAIPEQLRDEVKVGDALGVSVDSLTTNLTGIVSEIDPAADPNSRTLMVKLDLPPTRGVYSGEFARVAIPTGEVSALWVPWPAVVRRGDMELLFVAANQHAQLRIIRTGARMGDEVEVVSGLNPGEAVVVSNASDLADGQPVIVNSNKP